MGREFKTISCSPIIPGETSTSLGLEVEEDVDTCTGRRVKTGAESLGKPEGIRPASLGRVRKNLPMFQE